MHLRTIITLQEYFAYFEVFFSLVGYRIKANCPNVGPGPACIYASFGENHGKTPNGLVDKRVGTLNPAARVNQF